MVFPDRDFIFVLFYLFMLFGPDFAEPAPEPPQ
jgi:hypothetical protein